MFLQGLTTVLLSLPSLTKLVYNMDHHLITIINKTRLRTIVLNPIRVSIASLVLTSRRAQALVIIINLLRVLLTRVWMIL